jgi:hypothetical protein
MDDVLHTLVPSYNVVRFPIDDEVTLVRSATLRGLPSQNTLILVNDKRRHRSGVIAFFFVNNVKMKVEGYDPVATYSAELGCCGQHRSQSGLESDKEESG